MTTRREWLRSLGGTVAGVAGLQLLARSASAASAPVHITVYKDPSCGCCTQWVAHLARSSMSTTVHDRADMDSLKDSMGVPAPLRSCHTAVVGRYIIEGHVPAADIRSLLATAPRNIVGLAVPGMPAGSPGMEMGARKDRYDVMAFTAKGSATVFRTHA